MRNACLPPGFKGCRLRASSRRSNCGVHTMKTLASISITLVLATQLCAQSAPKTPVPQASSAQSATPATSKISGKRASIRKSSRKHSKPAPVVAAPVAPQPPPPPPTLAQQAPVAPRVTFQNGLLFIDAPNSTLGDILNGIRRVTGATIDGPSNVNDRVIVHLGPGQPRDVMNALLSSSRFNFVVMGTPQQPNGLSRIVLMARQGTAEPPATAANNTPVARPMPQRQPVISSGDSDEDEVPERDEETEQPPSPPTAVQPEGQYTGQPQQQMPPDQNAPQAQGDPNQANQNAPKTPEQLYKELQDLERQRQQPQNQPPTNPDQQPR